MNRPSLYLSIALALTFSPVSPTRADITRVNFPTPLAEAGSISGDIVNMDSVNNFVQIRDVSNMLVQTIHIDDHVQILRRGEVVRLVNLAIGDFVTVSAK